MSNKFPFIGVTGCLYTLPDEFPMDYPENSGNMVHANAPRMILKNTFHAKDNDFLNFGYPNFVDFVNSKCSHLVITLANTLRLNDNNEEKYLRSISFLDKIEKPIVVFGLGIQSKYLDIDSATLAPAAIQFVKLLSQRSKLLGVRGESTKIVLERLCEVSNIFVTGCPSLFSNIRKTYKIYYNLKNQIGRPSFSGTRYFENMERNLFMRAIQYDQWLIEPVNKINHQFFLDVNKQGDVSSKDVPYFLRNFLTCGDPDALLVLRRYFESRYRLFRTTREWYKFVTDFVSYSYGTRFHVNMASVINGKPALWIIHDERTLELTKFLHLPAIKLENSHEYDFGQPMKISMYDDFFDHFPKLIDNFNFYLTANDLTPIKHEQTNP